MALKEITEKNSKKICRSNFCQNCPKWSTREMTLKEITGKKFQKKHAVPNFAKIVRNGPPERWHWKKLPKKFKKEFHRSKFRQNCPKWSAREMALKEITEKIPKKNMPFQMFGRSNIALFLLYLYPNSQLLFMSLLSCCVFTQFMNKHFSLWSTLVLITCGIDHSHSTQTHIKREISFHTQFFMKNWLRLDSIIHNAKKIHTHQTCVGIMNGMFFNSKISIFGP